MTVKHTANRLADIQKVAIPPLVLTLIMILVFQTSTVIAADLHGGQRNWESPDAKAMETWQSLRFGMFIHWGPVSLNGTEIGWSRNKSVPIEEYDTLYKRFDPQLFDAAEWVSIAQAAGMKYIVLTTKHHDGFCLWDSKTTDYDIMATPFGRDVVQELASACKNKGILFCAYYSIADWYHPDYPNPDKHGKSGYSLPAGQQSDMDRYENYMKQQLHELLTNYGPLGVLWFDGEWEEPWTHERGVALYNWLRDLQPSLLINNRVDKGREGMKGITSDREKYKGDFDTPEQQIGRFQTDRPWESCITLCEQWAWKPQDQMKSLEECIHTLVRTVGGDGNLLLNIGPMPDGRIEARQVERLKEIGNWLEEYGAAIYGTRGGPFQPQEWGVSTHRGNKVYVHVLRWPGETIVLPGLEQQVIGARLMGEHKIDYKQSQAAIEITLPEHQRQPMNTILVLELEQSVKL